MSRGDFFYFFWTTKAVECEGANGLRFPKEVGPALWEQRRRVGKGRCGSQIRFQKSTSFRDIYDSHKKLHLWQEMNEQVWC